MPRNTKRLFVILLCGIAFTLLFGAAPLYADDDTIPADATLDERLAYSEAHPNRYDGTSTAGSSLENDEDDSGIATYANRERETYGTSWSGSGSSKAFYDGYGNLFASPSIKVIDVSQWQGTIDWNKVKNSGIDAVIIRFGWGDSGFDSQFQRNLKEVRRLGIPYGVYLFSYAANADAARSEANYTQQIVSRYNLYDMSLPIFYDLETGYSSDHKVITPTDAGVYEQVVNSYFNTLSDFGINNVSIYSGRWYTDTYLKAASVRPRVSWIAEYNKKLQTSFKCAGQFGWQYTSSEVLDGISANTVDMSAFSSADFVNVLNLPDFSVSEGTFYIDFCAKDSSSITVSNGSALQLGSAAGDASQRFKVLSAGNGLYRLQNEATGQYLSVADTNAQAGSSVVQTGYADDGHQLWGFKDSGSGVYIQSSLGNWVLDLAGGSTTDGTSIRIWNPNTSNAQKFMLASASNVKTDTPFIIQSALNKKLVMDIYGGSTGNLARLQVYDSNNTEAQKFYFKQVGNGLYEIVNVQSGKPFEAQGGTTSNGGAVSQYDSNGTIAQHWSVVDHGNGVYSFINAKSGKAIDVPGGNGKSGTGLQLYSFNGSNAQKWTLGDTKTVRQQLDELAVSNSDVIQENTIYAIGSQNERQVFDIAGGSTQAGANLQIYGSNATPAQRWMFSKDAKGYLTIKNVKSGKVLDVSGGSKKSGANVQQYDSNGTWAQKWIVVPVGDGSYKICSALRTDLVLDLNGGSTSNGSNVQVYDDNGTAAQHFRFYAAESFDKGEAVDTRTAVLKSADGRVADVCSGSTSDGASIQLYAQNGTVAQSFGIEYQTDKQLYALKAANSYRHLYAENGDVVSGTSVKQGNSSLGKDLSYYWSFVKTNNGSCRLVNAASGKTVGVASNGRLITVASDDTRVVSFTIEDSNFKCLRSERDSEAQEHIGDLADGTYVINSTVDFAYVFDVAGGSRDNSANVQLYKSNMTNAQSWTVSHDEQGYVTFTNVNSGKVLDVAGGVASNGRNVAQYAGNHTYAQKWIAEKIGNGRYRFESAIRPGFYLGCDGTRASNGVNVQLSTNGSTSVFALRSTSVNVSKCADILPKGYFTLQPLNSASGKVIDIASGSSSNGANAQVYAANSTLAQLFSFEYYDGYYLIRNAKSQKALDVDSGNLVPGTNVQQWDAGSGNDHQLFSVIDNGDGSYTFINKATGLALDIAGGADANGANLEVYEPNGSNAQKFSINQVTEFLTEGAFTISSSTVSKVLDVVSGSTKDGAAVQFYDSNDTLAQKWYVSKVAGQDNTYEIECIGSAKVLTETADGKIVQQTATESLSQRWHSVLSRGKVALQNAATGKYLAASGSSAKLVVVDSVENPGVEFDFKSTSVLTEGTYTIQLMSDRSRVLDVSGGSTNAGSSVSLYGSNGTAAQIWDIRKNSDDTYEISSAKSSKPLDIVNGSLSAGNRVQIWTRNEGDAQKWKLVYKKGEGYSVQAVNGLVLGDQGSGLALYRDNNASNSRFAFEKATYVPPILTSVQWKGCAHFSSTRYGEDWSTIVIHISECNSLSQIDNTFWGSREASAHYGVAPGQVHQYVNLGDTAWAVGNWEWNKRTVSIEHVGTTANPPSYATLDTSAQLMAALARSKGWRHLKLGDNVGIHKWYSSTSCPAGTDVNWLVARANQYLGN